MIHQLAPSRTHVTCSMRSYVLCVSSLSMCVFLRLDSIAYPSLTGQVHSLMNAPWGGSTNFDAAIRMILKTSVSGLI